jgi:cytochrome c553
LAAVALIGSAQIACRPDGAQKTLPGSELYAACASCHGKAGEGNLVLKAPLIAGLPAWYVEAQLIKFKTGARGAHPDDLEGLRMRPMSRQMLNDGEVKSVSAYIAQLQAKKPAPSIEGGDAAAGQAGYATCGACHGPTGAGLEAMKAPPLAGQSDWYLMAQLLKFKSGVRGTAPGDTTGGQMRPMAMTLANEQAIKNVVAHISTMSR